MSDADFAIGYDTEKWFEAVINEQSSIIRLKHRSTDLYDFIGAVGNKKFFLDVKFLKEKYRLNGFVEVEAWGKETGILKTAGMVDDDTHVFQAILHCGEYFIIDMKKLREAINKELLVFQRTIKEGCVIKFVVMEGFDDPRFCIAKGPMSEHLWIAMEKTSPLCNMCIDSWMKGVYKELK